MKTLLSICVACLLWGMATGQDGHFSQFSRAGAFINPAELAIAPNTFQLHYNHRKQWQPIVAPYTTNFIGLQKTFKSLGLGLQWSDNQAGPGSLERRRLMLGFGYRIPITAHQHLSIGYRGGLHFLQVDPSGWQTDAQYRDEAGYNAALGNGESLETLSRTSTDIDAGVAWTLKRAHWRAHVGLAVHHLLEPDQSLTAQGAALLPRRYSLDTRWQFRLLKSGFSLAPGGFLAWQGHAVESILGLTTLYRGKGKGQFSVGLHNRTGDALLFSIGFAVPKWQIGLSYDSNYSRLRPATRGRGAMELSFSLRLGAKAKPEAPETPAPQAVTAAINDRDKDGIPDEEDQCPDVFGWKQWQGCSDSDRDRVPDHLDACPMMPGQAAFAGCPDSDADGVADSQDACPYIAGVAENDGCPVQVEPTRAIEFPTEVLRTIVHFEIDKSVLTPHEKAKLRQQVDFLKEHPEATLLITGHTDASGSDAYNVALSQKRVAAVRAYLQELGVGTDRLYGAFYGEDQPVASNTTDKGKALNRRVEVSIMNLLSYTQ